MRWLRSFLRRLAIRFDPNTRRAFEDQKRVALASQALDESALRESRYRAEYIERASELIEAKQMSGTGPWLVHESRAQVNKPGKFRETNPITSTGATADISLMLENLAWLEFSRWGIQQIILISRLYYIKNPMIQRGINVAADYVFARGVEVSSDDETANETITDFFERNKSVLGSTALVGLEKRQYYDGQVFFRFFPDKTDKGLVTIRTIDATEIQDVLTDPDDTDEPRYYRRVWSQRNYDPTGQVTIDKQESWYPALNYEPEGADKLEQINGIPVEWDSPVYHMRGGVGVSKWHFDVPRVYAALDWAKTATKWLGWCATIKAALSQFAMTLTTKGGLQAVAGAKQQLETTVNTGANIWDTNPSATAGSIFASGPGTVLAPFNTKGAGGDPSEVKEYRNMVGQVLGIPPTWLGDLETANLATATTLDRPTETGFLGKQEIWREFFIIAATYVLGISKGAPSGKLRESVGEGEVEIQEAPRRRLRTGRWVYAKEAKSTPAKILVRAEFPAIREGDIPNMVRAVAEAMTLNNKGGQIIGIDAREGIRLLYQLFDVDNPDELLEAMFPDYDPDRTVEDIPAPIGKALPNPGGEPQLPNGQQQPVLTAAPPSTQGAVKEVADRLLKAALKLAEQKPPIHVNVEAPVNGHRKQKITRDADGRIATIEDVDG